MINYEQAVSLVYLGFRLFVIYRIITAILGVIVNFDRLIANVNRNKELKIEMIKAKNMRENDVQSINKPKEQNQDYRSTRIGFVTTTIRDES